MLFDDVDAFLDDTRFITFPKLGEKFGIGAAVTADIVAALFDLRDDVGVLLPSLSFSPSFFIHF